MTHNSELYRLILNLIEVGEVCQVDGEKALAKVDISGRVSNWMPVLSLTGMFKREQTPIRPGDQVLVLSPGGESDYGFILRGVFWRGGREPETSEFRETTEYEDSSVISYDTAHSIFEALLAGSAVVEAEGGIKLESGGALDIISDILKLSTSRAEIKVDDLELTTGKIKITLDTSMDVGSSGPLNLSAGTISLLSSAGFNVTCTDKRTELVGGCDELTVANSSGEATAKKTQLIVGDYELDLLAGLIGIKNSAWDLKSALDGIIDQITSCVEKLDKTIDEIGMITHTCAVGVTSTPMNKIQLELIKTIDNQALKLDLTALKGQVATLLK